MQKSAEATKALRAALLASDYSAQNVRDLATKAENAEAEVVTASIETWTQLRAILTADQVSKLQEVMSMPRQGLGPGGPPSGNPGVPPPPAH
jgi:Spy/CpxP family protein refolding chaperone